MKLVYTIRKEVAVAVILVVIVGVSVSSAVVVGVVGRMDKESLRAGIKKELLKEIHASLDQIVEARLEREMQRLLAQQNNLSVPDKWQVSAKGLAQKWRAMRSLVKSAIKEEIHNWEVMDSQLDQYVASGNLNPDVATGSGYKVPLRSGGNQLMQLASGKKTLKTVKSASDVDTVPASSEDTGRRPESIERTLQEKGSILIPKGTLQLEPSFTYAHFSSNRINIQGFSILPVLVIGDISTQEVNRDVFIESLNFKYGLMNNLQADLKVPYRQEFDRITNSSTSQSTRSASGFGDVEIGLSRQIGWEHGIMPDLIASLSVKPPTGQAPYNKDIGLGTGHWAVRSALIAAKSSDPAVVFGSINYTYNFERSGIENYGTVKPGDSVGYSLGTAIALSYQTAISFSFDQSVTFSMKRNDQTVTDSFLNAANLKFGFNWAINEKRAVDFAVSKGLTKDSPDFTVEFRFPYTF